MSINLEAMEAQSNNFAIPQDLRNRYVIWRHGESEANAAKVIASHPENGIRGFGLTLEGRAQVRRAILLSSSQGLVDSNSLLYSSPFLRCIETAIGIADALGIKEVSVKDELRERNFGDFEGRPKSYYQTVYTLDRIHPEHRSFGVESVGDVLARATGLVRILERIHNARTIVLVTHADVGEILQTAFMGLRPQQHRDLPKLKNAEPRLLRFMYT